MKASPSEQLAVFGVYTQPDWALHASSVQEFESSHTNGVPAPHTPAASQVSVPLQTDPSMQRVPAGSNWQVAEQQSPVSVLPSSQLSPVSTSPLPHTGHSVIDTSSIARPTKLNSPELSRWNTSSTFLPT